jgi:outer membrane lipoprotein-sorting protein
MRGLPPLVLAALLALASPLVGLAPPALAKPAAARLSADDRQELARVETYLNEVATLKGRFLQVAPSGATSEGDLYLSRPGKLRLEYDPPVPILVVATGTWLVYHDSELKQTSHVLLNSTPAGILVRKNLALEGADVTVTRMERKAGLTSVSMVQTDDAAAGEITLVFTQSPFQLRQWKVKDPQGQTTTVSLFDAQPGVALDAKLFEFADPKAGQPNLPLGN